MVLLTVHAARTARPPSVTTMSTPCPANAGRKPGQLSRCAVANLRNEYEIASLHVAALGKRLQKRGELMFRLLRGAKQPDPLHLRGLLRMHGKRPNRPQCQAQQRTRAFSCALLDSTLV
jgi:hypothetical protein